MKLKKRIRYLLAGVLGIAFLLFTALIIHIVIMVKRQGPLPNATFQLARADFKGGVSEADIYEIEKNVKGMKGVRATYFNSKDHILIYAFDNTQENASHIYDEAIKGHGSVSSRYIVSEAASASGCPAMNGNTFYGKLSSLIYNIIN